MNLLLDTHVLLWFLEDSAALKAPARAAIRRAEQVWVSAASAWEVAIKAGLGRLRFDGTLNTAVTDSGFRWLPITVEHAEAVRGLPAVHGDPFDRLLVAQAQREGLRLVAHDQKLKGYGVDVLLV